MTIQWTLDPDKVMAAPGPGQTGLERLARGWQVEVLGEGCMSAETLPRVCGLHPHAANFANFQNVPSMQLLTQLS